MVSGFFSIRMVRKSQKYLTKTASMMASGPGGMLTVIRNGKAITRMMFLSPTFDLIVTTAIY